jgi:hypothetical protein
MVTVAAAGIDTWSPAWYVAPGSLTESALTELAVERVARGRALPDPIAGYRVGWFPGSALMWAEGHPGGDRLGCADALPIEFDRLAEALDDFGLPVPRGRSWAAWVPSGTEQYAGFAGVRRLDATADLRFESSDRGRAVLAAVAAVVRDAPRTHAELRFDAGKLQTVYMRGVGGKKVVGRWYDKGAESAGAPIGQWIRAEDQRRFVRATRRDVEELSTSYVRSKFRSRFLPLWQASRGVTVVARQDASEQLLRLVDEGMLSLPQAERLAGYLLLEPLMVDTGLGHTRATRKRRRAELRDLGVVVTDGELAAGETVELEEVLEQLLDSDVWERRG